MDAMHQARMGMAPDDGAWFPSLADEVMADVCTNGFHEHLDTFVQHYGSDQLDASLLRMPLVGFLPSDAPGVAATVDAIADTPTQDGLVLRYRTDGDTTDGPGGDEGTFLLCAFWLVQASARRGEGERASAVFERALAVRHQRMVGSFPQAFSPIGLLAAARSLESCP